MVIERPRSLEVPATGSGRGGPHLRRARPCSVPLLVCLGSLAQRNALAVGRSGGSGLSAIPCATFHDVRKRTSSQYPKQARRIGPANYITDLYVAAHLFRHSLVKLQHCADDPDKAQLRDLVRSRSSKEASAMSPASGYTGSNRLLAALPPADFAGISAALEPVSLTLRQVIEPNGAPVGHAYFIESGVASVLTTMADGAAVEVGMIGNEGMVGLAGLFGEAAAQQVIVQIPGTAARLPIARLRAAVDESAAVRQMVLRFAGVLFNLGARTAGCNRLHSIEQRCARWLLMARDRAQSNRMPITHEFLAAMLGVRRAGVTTTVQELQRSGLISYRQREIMIQDGERLEAFACECYQLDRAQLDQAPQ